MKPWIVSPKIGSIYGDSESGDFHVACGAAQTNLRYAYIDRTLEALNIEPGIFSPNTKNWWLQK
jgi:hypothetical protein